MKSGKAPYIPPERLELVLQAQTGIHALRDQAILLVSHYSGLRAKELAALRVSDVYDKSADEVRDVLRMLPNMTKGGKSREAFIMNQRAKDTIKAYLHARGAGDDLAPLFLSQKGGHFSPNTMQKLVAICYDRSGTKASSHSGRRSFATRLLNSGANIYLIKELLGHSSIVTTQEYFVTSPDQMMRAVSQLA